MSKLDVTSIGSRRFSILYSDKKLNFRKYFNGNNDIIFTTKNKESFDLASYILLHYDNVEINYNTHHRKSVTYEIIIRNKNNNV